MIGRRGFLKGLLAGAAVAAAPVAVKLLPHSAAFAEKWTWYAEYGGWLFTSWIRVTSASWWHYSVIVSPEQRLDDSYIGFLRECARAAFERAQKSPR